MEFKYCPECGLVLELKEIGDEGLVPYCNTCKKPHFNFSYSCVIVCVVNEYKEIALIRQSYVSDKNWILVAGYLKKGETLEETVSREVFEETGLTVESCNYISSFYFNKKDLLMLGFLTHVKKEDFGKSKEVDEIKWFSLEEAEILLTPSNIAKQLFDKAKGLL